MAFAAGFAVRPFGALVFGRVGDIVGRKNTFLVTMAIMGLSTFAVGFLPGYDTIGIAAPIILMLLRLLQGLAIGGEYGGAAVYIAEHAPPGKRGFYTSFIQTTAMLGLILASSFVVGLRTFMDADTFNAWGWRLPKDEARMSPRSEEHTSELQSLMRISYAVFCLKKKKQDTSAIVMTNRLIKGQS